MAVIGKIRKQSGLLIIIVGVALAAFVLGDFLNPGRQSRKVMNVGEVFGEEIPITEFNQKVEQNANIQKRNQQKENLDAGEMFKIKDQTWKKIIDDIIMGKEYEKLGILVSPDELFDLVQGDNPHPYISQNFRDQETQQYDPQLVRNYLNNLPELDMEAKQNWKLFETAIKDDRLSTKYKNLISKAYFMPDTLCYVDFMDKKIGADIRFVGYLYSKVSDTLVQVTDDEYLKYYEEKKYNYIQKATRDIDYVVFDVTPSATDRDKIKQDVFAVFEDFKNAQNVPVFVNMESDKRYDSTFFKQGELPVFMDSALFNSEVGTFFGPRMENDVWHIAKLMDIQFRPDSMKATHLLISYKNAMGAGNEIARSKEEAKKMADSLFNLVNSNPSKMEELAVQLSDDPSAAENSGDLGWFADGAMVYPFNQAVLEAGVNNITRAESVFGYHIIKVTGKKEPVKKVRVAIINREIKPSNATFQDKYADASRFAGEVQSLESFDTIAENMGLNVRTATYLDAMGSRIAGFDYPRPIIQWAHMENVKVGTVSPVFTFEDKYVVAIVTASREDGFSSPEDMDGSLRPLVKKFKKWDIVAEKMKDALNQTTDLYELANILGSRVDTMSNVYFSARTLVGGYGSEPKVIAAIMDAEENTVSGPVKGDNGAYIFIVDKKTPPNPGENHTIFRAQLINNFTSKVNNNSYLTTLEEEADIEDNRVMFY
ncbi:MAG: SurA N-terminal domain-containing protein [Bacteroidales bacterium]|nr:SurA N-terminal domain-containing protein [Bacteroidales bacterium]